MSPRICPSPGPSPAPRTTVDSIAAAYMEAAGQDAEKAMRRVIEDALVDLCEAERRTLRRDRLISTATCAAVWRASPEKLLWRDGESSSIRDT